MPEFTFNTGLDCFEIVVQVRLRIRREDYDACLVEELKKQRAHMRPDASLDASLEAMRSAVARMARVDHWFGSPQAHMEIVEQEEEEEEALTAPVRTVEADKQQHLVYTRQLSQAPGTMGRKITDYMRERARHVPLHLWEEQCLTPLPDKKVVGHDAYARTSHVRSYERQALARLRFELQDGKFALDPEAEAAEQAYQERLT